METNTFVDYGQGWFRERKVSTDTPLFLEKRAAGDILPVNYFLLERVWGNNPLSPTPYGDRQYSTNQSIAIHGLRNGGIPSSIRSEIHPLEWYHVFAANRLRAKVNQATLEGGLILAEFGKTADFVRSAMVQTAKGIRAAKRGDVKGVWNAMTNGKPLADAVADGWLAWSYAVKPVMNDVAKAVVLLEEGLRIDPITVVKTAKKFPVDARWEDVLHQKKGDVRKGEAIRGDIRASGGLAYRVDDPVFATLSALGFTNPLGLAWELVPFSFVVDWFVPVNNYLQSFGPPKGVSFLYGWTKVSAHMLTKAWSLNETVPDPGWNLHLRSTELLKERKPLQDFPVPTVQVPDLSLSKEQLASGLALLQQAAR